jgi:hypothetical protein
MSVIGTAGGSAVEATRRTTLSDMSTTLTHNVVTAIRFAFRGRDYDGVAGISCIVSDNISTPYPGGPKVTDRRITLWISGNVATCELLDNYCKVAKLPRRLIRSRAVTGGQLVTRPAPMPGVILPDLEPRYSRR